MYGISDQINAAFERDLAEAQMVTDLSVLPVSYDYLTNEWLTALVCYNTDAQVVAFRAEDSDDLNKGHKRIWLSYNRPAEELNLPPSVFCKDSHRLELRLLKSRLVVQEVDFYHNIQPNLGLETPNCIFAEFDPVSFNSLLVFDDLRSFGGEFCSSDTEISLSQAHEQVELLARLHARFFGTMNSDPCLAQVRQFSDIVERMNGFFKGGLATVCDQGFRLAKDAIPGELRNRADEIWPATAKVFALNAKCQDMLVHGDAHLRNWYVNERGTMRLGDWEVVSRGDGIFDVAYAIATSLAVQNRRAWEEELLRSYLRELSACGGPQIPFAHAWSNYCVQLFLCLAWWTPCVPIQPDLMFQPADATRRFINRITTAIADHDSLRVLSTL